MAARNHAGRNAATDDRGLAAVGHTTALLRWEGGSRPRERRRGALVHKLPSGAVNVGGKPAELLIYRVFLTVPQGTPGIHGPLNEQRRNEPRAQGTCLRLSQ